MNELTIPLQLTDDQLAGLDHEVERHNAEGEAKATEEAPFSPIDRAGYVQFVMSNACQSYFNNMPK